MFDRSLDVRVYVSDDVRVSARGRIDVTVKVCLTGGLMLGFMYQMMLCLVLGLGLMLW